VINLLCLYFNLFKELPQVSPAGFELSSTLEAGK